MVDNFNVIRGFMKFENPGDFYFLELLQRKKDGNNVVNGHHNTSRLIKDYYISSLEQYDNLKDEIVEKCNSNNARAYIRLNKRNYKTVSLAFAEQMLMKVRTSQDFRNPKTEIASIVGQYHDAGKEKTWIVDLDDVGIDDPKVKKVIDIIAKVEPFDVEKVLSGIPTKSGLHLITKPFNHQKFSTMVMEELGENIDVHKDNPTVLYVS